MAKTIPIPEHFQHFLAEMKEGFWGMCTGRPRRVWKQLSAAALWQRLLPGGFRDRFGPSGCAWHAPGEKAFCRAGSCSLGGG
jgi:hypothetical protein